MNGTESKTLTYGSNSIHFVLERAARKTLGIQVRPDSSVRVIAPMEASEERILEKVRQKARWILKQQSYFLSYRPLTPPRRYLDGETHLYLGRQYRMRISTGAEKQVKLKGKYLEVSHPAPGFEVLEKLVEDWFRAKADRHFREILQTCLPRFAKYDLPAHELVIRKMEKRWGSCAPSGRITLNLELIKAPKTCIEYVIVHELCHLLHPGHNAKFFALQDRMMPDWQKWKERLERVMA